jgi:carboxymethylenebutenolidase
VNSDIRKTCDELAEQAFIAVAPDLFWRQEPGVDLSVTSEPDWQHGLRLYQAYDRDAGAKDVKDTVNSVAKLPRCTGSVAVLGYCLGGRLAGYSRRTDPQLRHDKTTVGWHRHGASGVPAA